MTTQAITRTDKRPYARGIPIRHSHGVKDWPDLVVKRDDLYGAASNPANVIVFRKVNRAWSTRPDVVDLLARLGKYQHLRSFGHIQHGQ